MGGTYVVRVKQRTGPMVEGGEVGESQGKGLQGPSKTRKLPALERENSFVPGTSQVKVLSQTRSSGNKSTSGILSFL